MATVAGIKIKVKAKVQRNPLLVDEKYTGSEPVWDTERAAQFDDATFDNILRRAFYYYNYFYNQKDLKKYVVEWLKTQKDYTKEDVKSFERAPDRAIEMTVCSLIKAHKQGMPFRGRHLEYINGAIRKAIAGAGEEVVEEVKEEKPKAYVPTIQDRMNEKTAETIGELEGHYDEMDAKFKHYDFLVTNNVPQSQLSKYEDLYLARRSELEEAQAGKDDQLKEGYSHLKAADFKKHYAWIDSLVDAVAQYRNVKKATKKVRAPRAVSKEKVVAKLKYAKENKELKIVSVNPADIIGAQELWVYNAKTRKLGKYVADGIRGPLGVKGTSIIGYDENKSTSKTLRKPEEKLKEFAKAGKIQLRKFIEDIKATETKLNGRISADVLLLRAV
jgi:hypothetical protein